MTQEPTRCILTFNQEHHQIHEAIQKYWFLLTADAVLTNYVTPSPSITYRRSTSLKDSLVSSHFINPANSLSLPAITTTPCGNCNYCEFLDIRTKLTLPHGIKWGAKHNVTCTTMGIIYLLQCPSGAYYVGKTSRPFNIRISEHIKAAEAGFFKTIIGRHVAFDHNYQLPDLKFLPLTRLDTHDRGGD